MLCEERESLEEQKNSLLVSRRETEDQLNVVKLDLDEQQQKIQEMEDRPHAITPFENDFSGRCKTGTVFFLPTWICNGML